MDHLQSNDLGTLPEGVRLGNEKLIAVTRAAGSKLIKLIEREQSGNYLRVKITGLINLLLREIQLVILIKIQLVLLLTQ